MQQDKWLRLMDALFRNTVLADHQKEKLTRLTHNLGRWLESHNRDKVEEISFEEIRCFLNLAEMVLELKIIAEHPYAVGLAGATFWSSLQRMWHLRELDYVEVLANTRDAIGKQAKNQPFRPPPAQPPFRTAPARR